MTPEQLAANLNKVSQQIASDFPQWANVALGNTALAMLKQRVVNKGIASDGSSFKPYSTKPMLIGAKSFRTKAGANSAFSKKGLEWRTVGGHHLAILPGGYKELRQVEGSQVDHKSFLRTGEMWLSIRTLGTSQAGQMRFITTIGSQVALSNKKLEGNEDREGKEILGITSQEEKQLTEILDKYITNVVQRAFNG